MMKRKIHFSSINLESQYHSELNEILDFGVQSIDRTRIGTLRKQHASFAWKGLGAIRGKKLPLKSIQTEAIWMLLGRTDLAFLERHGCTYWRPWVKPNGSFGPIYGEQLRHFDGRVDQLAEAVKLIDSDPYSRRIVLSLWNPCDLPRQALAPCHVIYQFCVMPTLDNGKVLDMHVTQRSGDAFLGVPCDFMLFSIMHQIVALACKITTGQTFYTINDIHIYSNHIDAVNEYQANCLSVNNKYIGDLDVKLTDNFRDTYEMLWDCNIDNDATNNTTRLHRILAVAEACGCDVFDFSNYKSFGPIKAPIAI